MKNYYKILGVAKDSNLTEIKKSYRKLALEYHPDKNSASSAEAKFIEITEAYEVLRDEDKRVKYDKFFTEHNSIKKSTQPEDFNTSTTNNSSFDRWKNFGKEKANEYSNMSFQDFVESAIGEIKFHGKHVAKIGCISYLFLFGGASMIFLPFFASDEWKNNVGNDAGLAYLIFMVIGSILLYFGWPAFKNLVGDYKNESKNR